MFYGRTREFLTRLNYCSNFLVMAVFCVSLNQFYEISICLKHRRDKCAPLLSKIVDLRNSSNRTLNTEFSEGY